MTKRDLDTKLRDVIYFDTTPLGDINDRRVENVLGVIEDYLKPLRTAWEDEHGRPDYHSFLQEFFGKQWPELDEAIATILDGDDRELPAMHVPKGTLLEASPVCAECGAGQDGYHDIACPQYLAF